jgi:hypothetical protein
MSYELNFLQTDVEPPVGTPTIWTSGAYPFDQGARIEAAIDDGADGDVALYAGFLADNAAMGAPFDNLRYDYRPDFRKLASGAAVKAYNLAGSANLSPKTAPAPKLVAPFSGAMGMWDFYDGAAAPMVGARLESDVNAAMNGAVGLTFQGSFEVVALAGVETFIVSAYRSAGGYYPFYLVLTSLNRLALFARRGSGSTVRSITAGSTIGLGFHTWQFTIDTATGAGELWLDGVSVGSRADIWADTPLTVAGDNWTLILGGRRITDGTVTFQGKIGQVQGWNRVLTSGERADALAALKARDPRLP